jgi:hypothetical protein
MTLKEALYAECFAAYLRDRKYSMQDQRWGGIFVLPDGYFDNLLAIKTVNLVASHGPKFDTAIDRENPGY